LKALVERNETARCFRTVTYTQLTIICIVSASGCTTATAAGCGVGVLAGMALAGVSVAIAGENANVSVGQVLVGGGLFGIASGCSAAAVADGLARSDAKSKPETRPVEAEAAYEGQQPHGTAAPTPGLITARTDLGGLVVTWFGTPATHPMTVGLRVHRYGKQPELAQCHELRLLSGSQPLQLPAAYRSQAQHDIVVELLQVQTDFPTAKALSASPQLELDVCGQRRVFTPTAMDAFAGFVNHFSALVPAQPPAAAVASDSSAQPPANPPASNPAPSTPETVPASGTPNAVAAP
jgi:hypothetical protein